MLLENRKSSNIVAQSYYRTSFRQLHWCLTFAWLHWVASRDSKFSAMIDSLLLQAVKQSLVLIFCTFFCAASTSDHLSSSHLMRLLTLAAGDHSGHGRQYCRKALCRSCSGEVKYQIRFYHIFRESKMCLFAWYASYNGRQSFELDQLITNRRRSVLLHLITCPLQRPAALL